MANQGPRGALAANILMPKYLSQRVLVTRFQLVPAPDASSMLILATAWPWRLR